jgi:glycosyltransferase involved in cell wall biosynthesis
VIIAIASPPVIPTPPPELSYGGIERLAWDLAEELGKRHKIYLIAGEGSRKPSGDLFSIPRWFESYPIASVLEEATRLIAECHALIDMTHTKIFAENIHGAVHKEEGRTRIMCRDIRSYSFWTDRAGVNPVFPSNTVAALMMESGSLCGAGYATIYPGIDLNGYKVGEKEDYFIYFGRIIPEKAVERAIHIAQEAGVRLLVAGHIGEFSYDKNYITMIRGMCTGKIEWVGELTHREKIDLLAHARGMIFWPRWVESFGINVVEALASGCPCIVGGNGGHVEQIIYGVNGYVVDSIPVAVKAVKAVSNGSIDPEKCAESAKKFSRERMAMEWEKLLGGGPDA